MFFTPVDCVGELVVNMAILERCKSSQADVPESLYVYTIWPFWNSRGESAPFVLFFIESRIVCVPEFDICIHYMAILEHGGARRRMCIGPSGTSGKGRDKRRAFPELAHVYIWYQGHLGAEM